MKKDTERIIEYLSRNERDVPHMLDFVLHQLGIPYEKHEEIISELKKHPQFTFHNRYFMTGKHGISWDRYNTERTKPNSESVQNVFVGRDLSGNVGQASSESSNSQIVNNPPKIEMPIIKKIFIGLFVTVIGGLILYCLTR